MSIDQVEARHEVRAPAAVIWAALADSRGWPAWSPNDSAELLREGDPPPDGVGAVRVFHTGRITVTEEITAFEPERRVAYKLLKGIPVRDYVGEVTLTPSADDPDVTVLVWRSSWRPKLPFTRRALRRGFGNVVDEWGTALARHAEAVAAGSSGG
jgi:uncharacterized protein YndB with AHSA1/START domain